MESLGYDVTPVDMVDGYGVEMTLGVDSLPDGPYDVILANYVLMFLNAPELTQVLNEVERVCKVGTVFVVEMYPAKEAFDYDTAKLVGSLERHEWKKIRQSKDRFVVVKCGKE